MKAAMSLVFRLLMLFVIVNSGVNGPELSSIPLPPSIGFSSKSLDCMQIAWADMGMRPYAAHMYRVGAGFPACPPTEHPLFGGASSRMTKPYEMPPSSQSMGATQHALPCCAEDGTKHEADQSTWARIYTRPQPSEGRSIDLRAVGDLMLGRQVGRVGTARGWSRMFQHIAEPWLAGDLSLANLESPLSTAVASDTMQLIGSPAAVPALTGAGFDILSLANNHAYDAGSAGLASTQAILGTSGIQSLGIGPDKKAAYVAIQRRINGLKIAFLAANDIPIHNDPSHRAAVWQQSQINDALLHAIQAAKQSNDLVVVMAHWGEEYASTPTARQQKIARQLIAAGADLIIGSHPHVLQPYALVEANGRHGIVLYSLGNFLFDQLTRWDTSSGAIARIVLDQHGVAILEAAPIDLVGWQIMPLPIDSIEGQQALHLLGAPGRPTQQAAAHPWLQAWTWDAKQVREIVVPRRSNPIIHPQALYVDLRGTGEEQLIELRDHSVIIHKGPDETDPPVWTSAQYGWPIDRIVLGDPNNDGRQEILMLVQKPDNTGIVRVHPYLLGYRAAAYKIIWGGSPRPQTIRDAAIADLNGDGLNELIFLEGSAELGQAAEQIMIFRWQGWFFYEEAQVPKGAWFQIDVRDVNGDGHEDLIATRNDGG